MGFMQIAEPPPENAEYIDACNELIEQCRKRGFGDDLTSKMSGDSLTAADMDVLRGAIIGALDMFFDPNQMKLSEDDPFTPPVINGGQRISGGSRPFYQQWRRCLFNRSIIWQQCTGSVESFSGPCHEYDSSSSEMKRQAIKRNDSDGIDLAVDLVTEYENGYELYDDTVVQVQKIFQYVNGEKKLQSINRRSRDGKKTWVTASGRTTRTIRANGENDGEEIETVVNYDGTTRVSSYDEGLRISETDSVFGEVSYFHDQFNREIGSDRESGGVTTSERSVLDDAGREISVTRTAGGKSLTTAFTYDALGRKLTETTPEGIVTNWSYTSRGEVETVSGGVYTQHYTYDSQGRTLTLTTYQNEDTPEITTYAYDSRGRMTRRTYPDNRSEQYTYRGDGKLSTYTNVRGIEQRYSYNQAGEQTGFSSGNDISRSFSYDQSGNILSVTDANGSYTFTRDEFGNVLTETAGSHTLTRSYDEYRRLIGLTLDGVALYTLSYGTNGRIEKVICGGAAVVYSYRSGTGQIASRNWQIGEDAPFLTFNDNYDALDRLSGVSVDDVPEISYTLDDDSRRITAELVDDSIWTYGYDNKSQLLTATRKSGETGLNAMTYAYDGIGNRTTASEDSAVVNYTANLLNQYTAVNEDTPAYDADGNMLTNAGWTYTWNSENRLVKAEKGTAKLEFAYDYQGRRMFKKVYDGDTLVKHEKYLYNGYKLIAVYDGMNSDALLKTFVWQPVGLDVPLCMTAGSAVYYYLTDGNKNVTGLFDGTGTRAATYMYDPFGQTLSANGTAAESNPFRFSSEFFDTETGLVYYNYRYYDPKIGRWIKRDLTTEMSEKNLYNMVNNDIINHWDLIGLRKSRFYVAASEVRGDDCISATLRKANISHTDIVQNINGKHYMIIVGAGGAAERMTSTPLTAENYKMTELSAKEDGILRWGAAKKSICQCVSDDNIHDCLVAAKTTPSEFGTLRSNCQTDVYYKISGCCLEGFSPISVPVPELYAGDNDKVRNCINETIKKSPLIPYDTALYLCRHKVMNGEYD